MSAQAQTDHQKYIFFLHNRFIQLYELNEVHPEYGKAAYHEILDRFRGKGFTVISEKRPVDTDVEAYALLVGKQIDSLLSKGVNPQDITVIGTSMGGYIAQYVSSNLRNEQLNFVLVACFREEDMQNLPEIKLCGNILSIYEKSDTLGVSMQARVAASHQRIPHFREIELQTMLKHGFIYKPLDEWIKPALRWAQGDYSSEAK